MNNTEELSGAKKGKPKKRLLIKLYEDNDINTLADFKKVVAYMGGDVVKQILELMDCHVREWHPIDIELVTEKELLVHAKSLGLHTNKASVVKYRNDGLLKDEEGNNLFWTDETRHIVYNRDAVIEFLKTKTRNKALKTNVAEG